ncbi:hypothetical protein HAX54_038805 [Datura stramonium]|uniref:Uncharacterized protein n=1 Tax=Datura stramonium TaxID=4076 RepID=A0ABS8VP96_DATST|nr:hypothetical protein [Datura stramonium]
MGEGVLCHAPYGGLDRLKPLNSGGRGGNLHIRAATFNKVLGFPNPPEIALRARDVEGNGQWLMDTLVVESKRPRLLGASLIVKEWRYFPAKSMASLLFPALITMLYEWESVPKETRDDMIECDVPFNPLRVKGRLHITCASQALMPRHWRAVLLYAPSLPVHRGGSGAGSSMLAGPFDMIEAHMVAMREFLGGFLKPPHNGMSSSAISVYLEGLQGEITSLT